MKFTKKEFQVLWQVEEGNSSPEDIVASVSLNISDVKNILKKLDTFGFIELKIKFDNFYKEEFWNATTTKKTKLVLKKYERWIPNCDFNKLKNNKKQ